VKEQKRFKDCRNGKKRMESVLRRGASFATILAPMITILLIYNIVLDPASASAVASYRYSCNLTLIIQGDVSDLGNINQVIVFPNTTRQTTFIERAKGVVNGAECRGSLTLDEQGNAILVFDFPLDAVKDGNRSIVTLYIKVTIVQRVGDGSVPIDELKRALLNETPLGLRERYAGNSTAWPISPAIYSLALSLAEGRGETYYDVLSAFSEWIEEHVAYPLRQDVREFIGPQYPDETYESKIGDCDDRGILFTTMCRAVGIPSFLQAGGIPEPASQYERVRYDGNYVYKSKGIVWHAWSMVYVSGIGWVPVDTTYFGGALIKRVPGGLCYIRSPEGLDPKITSSAYFIANPIIYANFTSLKHVEEARAWELAVKEGRVKIVYIEELEVSSVEVPIPIEVPFILGLVLVIPLLSLYFNFRSRRRQDLLKKAWEVIRHA